MKEQWKVISLFMTICLLMLSSCQSAETPSEPATTPSSTVADPSQASSISQNNGSPPSIPSATRSPIVRPTMTFVPRLPMAEAEADVLNILLDNGGCRFPCFWGFTLGQTTLQAFISTRYAWGGSTITLPRDELMLEISFLGGSRDEQSDVLDVIRVSMIAYRSTENQRIKVYDNPFYAQNIEYYTLPHLLMNYGPPMDAYILLDAGIEDMGLGIDLFFLALDYTADGWVALLEMPLLWKDETRQVALGCPTQAFTSLRLWSPDDTEMAKVYGYADGHGVALSVAESSFMTLEEFYDTFKNPENTSCLELPIDMHDE